MSAPAVTVRAALRERRFWVHYAQMLVAISAAHELGYAISAFDIIPNLFYPYLLAVSSFFFIAIDGKKKA